MTDWVDLPGRLDRTAIRHELARSSVFLAPAELESFGIAALEARTVGLPVVASSRSGVGEFVTHGTEGLMGDSDADLAGLVARLVTDRELSAGIAGHNAAVAPHHDWAHACRCADRMYAVAASAVRPVLPGLAPLRAS
jgi:glycosyltransferase involved in cell wall biosynthesis